MSYSRELKALDTRDVAAALNRLLGQLNLVQSETDRQIEQLKRDVAELRALVKGVGTRESGDGLRPSIRRRRIMPADFTSAEQMK